MRRMTWIAAGIVLLPGVVAARQVPSLPPVPPPAPVAPAPPVPMLAPVPSPPAPPQPPAAAAPAATAAEMRRLQDRMREVQDRLDARLRLQLGDRAGRDLERELRDMQRDMERDAARMSEEARRMAERSVLLSDEDVRRISEEARLAAEDARLRAELDAGSMFAFQGPQAVNPSPSPSPRVVTPRIVTPRGWRGGESDDAAAYAEGLSAVQQRQYDQAITLFDRVLAQKTTRADGALYWKAFAQARLVRVEDALTTLATLRRDHPQSRYLTDAKVLEADVRKMTGQQINPETLDANDEIKLLAINGIANTDPDRAIPLLETVLNATNTLGNKKRALYVLALNDDPRAHQILLRHAKGDGTPELQLEAVRYLALRQDGPTRGAELREVYESTQDPAVRRAIIEAFRMTGDKGFLVAVAKDKTVTIDLKRSAINGLGTIAPPTELWTLYQQETDPNLRSQMVMVFASRNATEQLLQIAKTEKDANVRLLAVRRLGSQGTDKTGAALVDLYGGEQDANVRRSVIAALASQNNAEALVAIARMETNLDLKRDVVRRLSDLAPKNKAAADYLMEVIK